MTILAVIILSLVEGTSEFLPISSTGHLILASRLLQIPPTEFVKTFTIVIQLGAILAVLVLYFPRLIRNFKLWSKIIAAFIPTALIGLVLYKFIKSFLLGNLLIDILSLFIGGVLIIVLEKIFAAKPRQLKTMDQLSLVKSGTIGLVQSISVIPGVSRAAATIFGGMGLGLTRQAATEFSFLLAIPTMAAAAGLDLIKTRLAFTSHEYLLILIGFIGAFISALFTVKWLINFVSRHSFIGFGIYRILLALVFFILLQ
ncbi:MAG: undecaprenyl-diphosphate phosphatase [Candidatus Beckwithbacteria bacterium]|nr:undecaprenyl-diphosphate phosphatase [Candidatus Beckwithbacteria bacterium]